MADSVETARDAFARQAWGEAHAQLDGLPRDELDAADLERLAIAAYLTGRDEEYASALEAAHRRHLDHGDVAEAARCSFWMAMVLMMRGEGARGGGWLSRTQRLVEEHDLDCPAAGYLLVPGTLGALESGDAATAAELAERIAQTGERFDDHDLRAFGTLGHGQALIAMGEPAAGTARLDEVMVSVTSGEVGPITTGIVYCAVILECMQLFDLARAAEWTEALSRWCDAQPDLVPYRGQCLVHRSQIQQAAGDWADAIDTAEAACRRLTDPPHPALGLAHYQEAELLRLRGDLDEARSRYRLASRHGHHAMPGLALLDLTRGDAESAVAGIRRALQEAVNGADRPPLLAAAVDILRATGDAAGAREAADELAQVAERSSSAALQAMAAQATGAVLLAEGDPASALAHLRPAAADWQRMRVPYEAARTSVLLGLSCAALGDRSSAALELDGARATFTDLGARPDLERVEGLLGGLEEPTHQEAAAPPGGRLSERELEILGHVAAGKTNRQIADELVISQHTVGRHLENIFAKLGVTSRAAATSWAYEHDLL